MLRKVRAKVGLFSRIGREERTPLEGLKCPGVNLIGKVLVLTVSLRISLHNNL